MSNADYYKIVGARRSQEALESKEDRRVSLRRPHENAEIGIVRSLLAKCILGIIVGQMYPRHKFCFQNVVASLH